jgi:hypothetical protein
MTARGIHGVPSSLLPNHLLRLSKPPTALGAMASRAARTAPSALADSLVKTGPVSVEALSKVNCALSSGTSDDVRLYAPRRSAYVRMACSSSKPQPPFGHHPGSAELSSPYTTATMELGRFLKNVGESINTSLSATQWGGMAREVRRGMCQITVVRALSRAYSRCSLACLGRRASKCSACFRVGLP